MTRVKGGSLPKTRRRKVLKEAKGYFGSKHRLYKSAQEQVLHSGVYAYRDRRQNKRNFRKLWITRINAACRNNDISYSKFINGLNIAGIEVNRKMLSELAIDDAAAFTNLVNVAKEALKSGKKVEKTTEKVEKVSTSASKEKTEVKKETKTAEKVDYSKMTLAELKNVAKEQGVKGYSTMKKDELISNLK